MTAMPCRLIVLILAHFLAACSSEPDYDFVAAGRKPVVQRGTVKDFHFEKSSTGGDAASFFVAEMLARPLTGGFPTLPETRTSPIYDIRLQDGKNIRMTGHDGLLLLRGDEVLVSTDPQTGRRSLVPVHPRQAPPPRY